MQAKQLHLLAEPDPEPAPAARAATVTGDRTVTDTTAAVPRPVSVPRL